MNYRNKPLGPYFRIALEKILSENNHKAYDRNGEPVRDCSKRTRQARKEVIFAAFSDIRSLGYGIVSPQSIKKKHVEALTTLWGEKGIAPRTRHTWLSMLRVFCGWIGKKGLVEDIENYYEPSEIRRSGIATTNLSWEAKHIDVAEVIAKAKLLDERFALYLSLQDCFGLRAKESIELRPIKDVNDTCQALMVVHGTKGGRPRILPIETEKQREVLLWASNVAQSSGGRIRWPGLTWEQAQRKYYYFTGRAGITRKEMGVTSHGLRHKFAQSEYRKVTDLPTPIEGGAIGKIDRQTHLKASLIVTQKMGHGRINVMSSYCGSYGHRLRNARTPADLKPENTSGTMTRDVQPSPSAPG
jgi:site-specific recombinase XerD